MVAPGTPEEEIIAKALADPKVQSFIAGKQIVKKSYRQAGQHRRAMNSETTVSRSAGKDVVGPNAPVILFQS